MEPLEYPKMERPKHLPVDRVPRHTRAVFKHENGNCEQFKLTAEWAARRVKELDAGAIVACGHSGLVLAGAVSLLSGVPVFAVRKPGEKGIAANSDSPVTGYAPHGPVERWVWLVVSISSGRTFMWSAGAVMRAGLVASSMPVMALLYARRGDDKTERVMGDGTAVWNDKVLDWAGDRIPAESFDQDPTCPWYDAPSPPIVKGVDIEVQGVPGLPLVYPTLSYFDAREFLTSMSEMPGVVFGTWDQNGPIWNAAADTPKAEAPKSNYFGDTKALRRAAARMLLDKPAQG